MGKARTDETKSALNKQGRVKLNIPAVPGEGAQVEVCINGYWTVIRRGDDVEVPQSVAEVLRQANIV